MCVYTVTAHEFSAFEAVTYLCALYLTNATAGLISIATLSDSQQTQQPVMMKPCQQFIKAICFGKIDLSLAFRAAKLSFSLLISACFFKHSQQNVCRQVIVLGSVKVSRQIEQVTCSLTIFNRDSIVKSCFTVTKYTFLKFRFRCDSGILDIYIGLEKNSFIYPWASNQILRSLPSDGAEMFIVIFKGAFS